VDIDGKTGDPVVAIGAGRVVMVSDRYYAGGTVVIDHGLRLYSLYFHLSEFLVEVGDNVEKGQLIGKVGRSGRVTGPHLHLGTRVEGLSFDPLSLLKFDFEGGEARP
jgi:murein DD-endopeptidase MepM/ murein hydrolase activator NlpD